MRIQDGNSSLSSDSDEECLRPSLLRKRRQLHSQTDTPQHGMTPWNCQAQTPIHKATPVSATAYDSPAHQTPFAALFSSCPSTGVDSHKGAHSPAEPSLRGNPTPGSLCFTPVPGSTVYGSPNVQQQARSRHSVSKVVTHISKLQREHAHLAQQLKEHENRQRQWDLQLQDEAFLQNCLQQLRGTSATHQDGASDTAVAVHPDSRPTGESANVYAQPAQPDTLELWQQLSSESSSSNEGHQLEELQAQLLQSHQQLHSKEAEVIGLTVELVSLHSQLEAAKAAHQTESSILEQLDSSRRHNEALSAELEQSRGAVQDVKSQLQASEEALCAEAASHTDFRNTVAASEQSWRNQLCDTREEIKELSRWLEQSRASNLQLSTQLAESSQQLERVSQAHVMDESTMLDQLSGAQAELQCRAGELADARAVQAELSEQAAESRQQLADLGRAQTMTEEVEELLKELEQSRASNLRLSTQVAEANRRLEQVSKAHVMDESTMLDQLSDAQAELQCLTGELADARAVQAELSEQAAKSRQQLADLGGAQTMTEEFEELSKELEQSRASNLRLSTQLAEANRELEQVSEAHVIDESTMLDQLSDAQAELQCLAGELAEACAAQAELKAQAAESKQQLAAQTEEVEELSRQLEQSRACNLQLSNQLAQARHQLEQVSQAHVMDESTMLDQLSDAQAELECLTRELAEARAAQAELSEQAAESKQQLADLEEAQTMTEGTLLDQLTDAQTEVERFSIRVRHLEQRHQEMCQQLVMARVGQAEAMKASQHAKQQLRAAQPNPQGSLHEFASIQKRLTTAELELRQVRSQLAMSTKELSQSGMQNFELSQTLQDARTQLAAHLEANGKLQARAKKYRESHSSLCKQVEAAKAESAAFSQQLAQSAASSQQLTDSADTLQQELQHTQEQLKERTAELSQAHEAQAALQQQARQAQADKQQVRDQAEALSSQLNESAQQLSQSHESLVQLREQLQVATCSLAQAQEQCAQACSDSLTLRSQLAETASQLEQSCSRQAQYASKQQQACNELKTARAERERLACGQAQAEAIAQAAHVQLRDLHHQHRKLRAKCEQLAVRTARHEALHADLEEAQAQLGAQCARLQIEEQKARMVSRRLVAAGRSLADALYRTHADPPQPALVHGDVEASTELSSAAEQVCCLVEALLLHYNHSRATATGGREGAASARRGVNVLRSHVAEAQARANHIVDEFESMLMVTGGHSMKEVKHIQSQAGLASDSPSTGKDRKLAQTSLPVRKQSSSGTQTPIDRPSSGRSNRNSSLSSQAPRSVKGSATSKENRAPALTYVVGGQVRGSRKPHEVLVRHPLKPSSASNTRSTPAHR